MAAITAALDELVADARSEMAAQGVADSAIVEARKLHVRYDGTDSALIVDAGAPAEVASRFADEHERRYGFVLLDKALIVEAAAVEVTGLAATPAMDAGAPAKAHGSPAPRATIEATMAGEQRSAAVYDRDALGAGAAVAGPAILIEPHGTIIVEPGWRAARGPYGHIELQRTEAARRTAAIGTTVDPVMLEIFNNLFMSIAEQMGSVLENTASSVNIKERLDFSCALFDVAGQLIANAPHMPVHLGSMSESIQAVIRERGGTIKPGDVYVLNAPYNGGTHLPDVTVIAPVFDEAGTELLFFVGSRGHHADIGGITPGSMPPNSRTVDEEGVLIDNFMLVDSGRFREAEILALLTNGLYPARKPGAEYRRYESADCVVRKGRQRVAPHGRSLWPRHRARLHEPRTGQRRGIRTPRPRCAQGRVLRLPPRRRGAACRQGFDRPHGAQRRHRLHRHVGAALRQLQRANGRVPGGGALRVPGIGR